MDRPNIYNYKVTKLIEVMDGTTLVIVLDLGLGIRLTQEVKLNCLVALDPSATAKFITTWFTSKEEQVYVRTYYNKDTQAVAGLFYRLDRLTGMTRECLNDELLFNSLTTFHLS